MEGGGNGVGGLFLAGGASPGLWGGLLVRVPCWGAQGQCIRVGKGFGNNVLGGGVEQVWPSPPKYFLFPLRFPHPLRLLLMADPFASQLGRLLVADELRSPSPSLRDQSHKP